MTNSNDLWKIFQVESQQHLEDADGLIYQVLSLQEYDIQDLLRSLFRSFHSLKGLARAMDLSGLEEITHKGEDYLNFLLKSPSFFNMNVAHKLSAIIANMQTLCDSISSKKTNILPSESLIKEIEELNSSKEPVVETNIENHPTPNKIEDNAVIKTETINEIDEGVVDFFFELIGDFFVIKNEEKKQLIINASSEIGFKYFPKFIEDNDLKKNNVIISMVEELLKARKKNDTDLICHKTFLSFLKNILWPIHLFLVDSYPKNIIQETSNNLFNLLDKGLNLPSKSLIIDALRKILITDNISALKENLASGEEIFLKIQDILSNEQIQEPELKSPSPAKEELSNNMGQPVHLVNQEQAKPIPVEVEKSIRVSGSTLESFMDNIGEIVLNNARLNHFLADKDYKSLLSEIQFLVKNKKDFDDSVIEKVKDLIDQIDNKNQSLNDSIHSLNSSLSILHDTALNLRIVPMELIYRRIPRTVKLIADELQKDVVVHLEGQDVQIDKIMVDTLSDPIIHILRNALDHGIESPEERLKKGKTKNGNIYIKTEQQGSRIQLQIIDDGQGINRQKILEKAVEKNLITQIEAASISDEKTLNLIFHPGFSTAKTISNISGRGVGMDIVRMNVMLLGGSVSISSEYGKGTTFTIKVPITAAIQDVLVVNAKNQKIAIPNSYVNEVLQIPSDDIMTLKNNPACLLRNQYLPILNLAKALGYSSQKINSQELHTIVVISRMESTLGLEVDKVLEKTQVFMKEIDPSITAIPGIGGATIRGDGEVMIILDCEDIFESVTI
jgi:chemotaxis protein histidine kinase CheA